MQSRDNFKRINDPRVLGCGCTTKSYHDETIEINGLCPAHHTLYCTGRIHGASEWDARILADLEKAQLEVERVKLDLLETRFAYEMALAKFTVGGKK